MAYTPNPLDEKTVPISGDPSSFLWDEASCWKRVWFLICTFLFVMMVLGSFEPTFESFPWRLTGYFLWQTRNHRPDHPMSPARWSQPSVLSQASGFNQGIPMITAKWSLQFGSGEPQGHFSLSSSVISTKWSQLNWSQLCVAQPSDLRNMIAAKWS